MKAAINWIKSIASEPEVGHIYDGTVVKVMDFGAFVNFFGAKDGLVHISQLAPRRVQKVTDVVKEGDKVKVKLLGFDERGKVRLSMKVVDQTTGEDLEAKQKAEAEQQHGREQAAAGGGEGGEESQAEDLTKPQSSSGVQGRVAYSQLPFRDCMWAIRNEPMRRWDRALMGGVSARCHCAASLACSPLPDSESSPFLRVEG